MPLAIEKIVISASFFRTSPHFNVFENATGDEISKKARWQKLAKFNRPSS